MKFHQQTIHEGPEQDSFRACLASILEFNDVKSIPMMSRLRNNSIGLRSWLAERGLMCITIHFPTATHMDQIDIFAPEKLGILVGETVGCTESRRHPVVTALTKQGKIEIVHNPSKEKFIDLEKGDLYLYFIVRKAI